MKSVKDIIGKSPVNKMNEYEYMCLIADSYNDSKGNLEDGIDCPICKNKGFIKNVVYEPMYNDYIYTMERCDCMKKRHTLRKAKKNGLGDYINKRFNNFIVTEKWQEDLKNKAIAYCKSDTNDWFVVLGQSGSGKTLISCIITNYLLLEKNKEVIYITWTDFISKLKRDIMGDNSQEVSDYLESIKNVEVLFIDELLKKYNETDLKYVIEIINYRYTKDLKTIITSEKTLTELLEIDEATFSRMVEKSNGYISNIAKDIKKNYRLKNVL